MKKNTNPSPLWVLVFLVLFIFFTNKIFAQHFQSNSYIIDWGNFNMTSGSKTSTNYKLTDTVGQNAPGQYDSAGYIVKSGFQYLYETNIKFSFAISDLTIDLGILVPGVATTATNIITISSPAGHGYDIYASENRPLTQSVGYTIPDTTCDSGTCTQSVSAVWSSASAYGFGFNSIGINTSGVATGVGTSSIFANGTYFRQFANRLASESPQIIMSHNLPAKDHQARITYKANISARQTAGNYENSITFTAIPKY